MNLVNISIMTVNINISSAAWGDKKVSATIDLTFTTFFYSQEQRDFDHFNMLMIVFCAFKKTQRIGHFYLIFME